MAPRQRRALFVADTHALVWFIAKDRRLSTKAREILKQAEAGKVEVLIPTIVLAELLYIEEKGRAPVRAEEVLRGLKSGEGFGIVPFDISIFEAMMKLPENLELHDRIIAATGLIYKASLLTKDPNLQKAPGLKIVW